MSPLTAKLKCPHGRGEDTDGAEAVTEMASDEDGGGREDHLKGGKGKDRCVLPAGQTNSKSEVRVEITSRLPIVIKHVSLNCPSLDYKEEVNCPNFEASRIEHILFE